MYPLLPTAPWPFPSQHLSHSSSVSLEIALDYLSADGEGGDLLGHPVPTAPSQDCPLGKVHFLHWLPLNACFAYWTNDWILPSQMKLTLNRIFPNFSKHQGWAWSTCLLKACLYDGDRIKRKWAFWEEPASQMPLWEFRPQSCVRWSQTAEL